MYFWTSYVTIGLFVLPSALILLLFYSAYIREKILFVIDRVHIQIYSVVAVILGGVYQFLGGSMPLFETLSRFSICFGLLMLCLLAFLLTKKVDEEKVNSLIKNSRYIGHAINVLLFSSFFFYI
jgi:chromate transport protein ChrA